MPDFSLTLITAVLISLAVGFAIGWALRAMRNQQEQEAINAGWREEIDEHSAESERLAKQNSELLSQLMDSKAALTSCGMFSYDITQDMLMEVPISSITIQVVPTDSSNI